MAAELLGLFAAFPAQALSERFAEARARWYLEAVGAFPLAALRSAIGLWMRGEEAGPHDNHAFPPSPPQLVRLIRHALAPAHRHIAELEALAAARPAMRVPTTEERARVAALAAGFVGPRSAAPGSDQGDARTDTLPCTAAVMGDGGAGSRSADRIAAGGLA